MTPAHKLLPLISVLLITLLAGCSTMQAGQAEPPITALLGTQWQLATLKGTPVDAFGEQQQPYFALGRKDGSLSGFDGCNRISGSFTLDADRIKVGPIASTRMFCAKGAEQTLAFLGALERNSRYQINGNRLTLFQGEDELAAFVATAP